MDMTRCGSFGRECKSVAWNMFQARAHSNGEIGVDGTFFFGIQTALLSFSFLDRENPASSLDTILPGFGGRRDRKSSMNSP